MNSWTLMAWAACVMAAFLSLNALFSWTDHHRPVLTVIRAQVALLGWVVVVIFAQLSWVTS